MHEERPEKRRVNAKSVDPAKFILLELGVYGAS